MIKKKIIIALIILLSIITLGFVVLSFIKVDITTETLITMNEAVPYVSFDSNSASYIEKNEIEYVRMEYNKQYFNCSISYMNVTQNYTNYSISLPDIVDRGQQYLLTNFIVDSVNFYKYLIKK